MANDKTRFRSTLAGITVTIHEHLDDNVSIGTGTHVVGRLRTPREESDRHGPKARMERRSMEAGENKAVSTRLPHSLGNSPKTRDPTFPPSPTSGGLLDSKKNGPARQRPNRNPNEPKAAA